MNYKFPLNDDVIEAILHKEGLNWKLKGVIVNEEDIIAYKLRILMIKLGTQ